MHAEFTVHMYTISLIPTAINLQMGVLPYTCFVISCAWSTLAATNLPYEEEDALLFHLHP